MIREGAMQWGSLSYDKVIEKYIRHESMDEIDLSENTVSHNAISVSYLFEVLVREAEQRLTYAKRALRFQRGPRITSCLSNFCS